MMRSRKRRLFMASSAAGIATAMSIVTAGAAAATTCSNSSLWVGFSNPPRYFSPIAVSNAESRSIANWNQLGSNAGGAKNLPVHLYLHYLSPAEDSVTCTANDYVYPYLAGTNGNSSERECPYQRDERSWEQMAVKYAQLGYPVLVTIRLTMSQPLAVPDPTITGQTTTYPTYMQPDDYSTDIPSEVNYQHFVKGVIDRIGSSLEAVEITNEADVTIGSVFASDGNATVPAGNSNPKAKLIADDIIGGVEQAHNEFSALHETAKVGFNWAYDYGNPTGVGSTGNDFFHYLNTETVSDPNFKPDVDFFGEHTYPNFGSGATGTYGMTPGEIAALNSGRSHMNDLHLASSIPIRVTEIGYPSTNDYTGPTLDQNGNETDGQSDQATYWTLVINAAQSVATTDYVTTIYAFVYQENPSSAVLGDYGAVYPTPAVSIYNYNRAKPFVDPNNPTMNIDSEGLGTVRFFV